jgi:hypothetical protein
MEGGRWSVSLCANHGDAPPGDIDGFMAFVRSFRMLTIYNAIRGAKRIGDIARFIYPFAEAKTVLEGCAEIGRSDPEEPTSQVGFAGGPDGAPMVMVVPTWCGFPEEAKARLAPFFQLGTVQMSTVETTPYGKSLTVFDKFLVYGQRYLIETCWLPALDSRASTLSPERWRPSSRLAAPSSPTSLKAPLRVCRRERPPSACVGIICWSKLSRGSPISPTAPRSSDIGSGHGPRARPSTQSPYPVDIRICLPATKT